MIFVDKFFSLGKDKAGRPKYTLNITLGTDVSVGAFISMTPNCPISIDLGLLVLHLIVYVGRNRYEDE